MVAVRLARIIPAATLLVAAIAACSGGGSSTATGPKAASAPASAPIGLTFTVPARVASAKRRAHYISPATASFGIFVATVGGTFANTPDATLNVGGNCSAGEGGQTCSTIVAVPVGSVKINVRAYTLANALGSVISAGTVTVTVYPNATNHVALSLGAIVNSFTLSFATPSAVVPVTVGTPPPTSVGITITALDASGQPVTGLYADANGVPVTLTLSTSGGGSLSRSSLVEPETGVTVDVRSATGTSLGLGGAAGSISVTTPAPLAISFHEMGQASTYAGIAGTSGSDDGDRSSAHFQHPGGIAIDAAHAIYVADVDNNVVRKIDPLTNAVTTIVGDSTIQGSDDKPGHLAHFRAPSSVAVDALGNVYVTDANNSTIRKIAPDLSVSTLAGSAQQTGNTDGSALSARFHHPVGLAVAADGTLYVTDSTSHTIRKIDTLGNVTTLAGAAGTSGSANGNGAAARFNAPQAIAVDAAGTLYVADSSNDQIRKITAAGVVTTLAGVLNCSNYVDGPGATACFDDPAGIAVDAFGYCYVADTGNHVIRKIAPNGYVTTLTGLARTYGTNDGLGTNARLNNPTGLVLDGSTLYVTDRSSHTLRIVQ